MFSYVFGLCVCVLFSLLPAQSSFLDADQLCLKNCDYLFNISTPAGICSIYDEIDNEIT